MEPVEGNLFKMPIAPENPVQYTLVVGEHKINLNEHLGKQITLTYDGVINCIACSRKTKKSFSQGHCYVCFRSLAACDMCIVKPELCHYAEGTCRQPEWGETHCLRPHIVYLANTCGLKVGVTRLTQVPTRWLDQGAVQAIPFFQVKTRLEAGALEVFLKSFVNDKTNWRTMLKGHIEPLDLLAIRDELLPKVEEGFEGFGELHYCKDESVYEFNYPVMEYPEKVKSLSFDKTSEVSGKLMGMKGQYLILDNGVINMRKFAGYLVTCDLS
jgi:hypothetical protein